jgi:putative FmdB family regulatory protein
MPLFDTKCTSCENEEEQLLKIDEDARPCSVCGEPTEKLITGVKVFEFKGEGTYDKGVTTHGEGKEENP